MPQLRYVNKQNKINSTVKKNVLTIDFYGPLLEVSGHLS